ncbi:dihydrodipicolinate synthase family protein [Roseiarcaceae bacterium H3SJ34-1]|uniref:dihydrodipicolinate synthase family protein n=1 Tax=Terripilifer ovatus TaxID=3032367 RepID=UPI003AB95C23|nr:dihydrodipicolinate synthase family protein [Roseiarcaceae bacterium H3SJ34-1]
MLTSKDISGLMAMMPAFATDDAVDYRSTATVDVARLHHGLDRMVKDGANVIATTGSFGEFYTLLIEEFRTLAHESVSAMKKRVPLFVGVTSTHTREVLQKCQIAQEAGADGILVGVPYYFPSTVDNAVRFFKDIGEAFPKLNIMIYHNPALHHVKLPVSAFTEIMKNPAVVAMKDSHRTPEEFDELMALTKGQLSVLVHQGQFAKYAAHGAPGFWSIDAWMGPWPQLALRDAVRAKNGPLAEAITADLAPPSGSPPPNLSWRETASKIGIRMAGYVDPGPLRPPFLEIPAEVIERQRIRIERWKELCVKYRPVAQAAE